MLGLAFGRGVVGLGAEAVAEVGEEGIDDGDDEEGEQGAGEGFDAFDIIDGFLEAFRDFGFHDLGIGDGVDSGDVYDWGSTLGSSRTGRRLRLMIPNRTSARLIMDVNTGLRMLTSGSIMAGLYCW